MAKANPFDYINAINSSKVDLMTGTANDQLAEKGYEPFLTNRCHIIRTQSLLLMK